MRSYIQIINSRCSDTPLLAAGFFIELLTAGYIRKVRTTAKRKNIRAYEFLSEYGAKTDMVSRALSHPLHQLTLSFARKDKPPQEIAQ